MTTRFTASALGCSLAVALGLGAGIAQAGAASQPPGGLGPQAPKQSSSGPNPAYFMPADPHLSMLDQARAAKFAKGKSLDNIGFTQVAAIENALIHPSLAQSREKLITKSLNTGR
ncbi:hypothetical protein AXZ77_1348 [Thioclava sp. ES.031]|uniref:hypothetical protein n=1 Tax=Thioclava sp. ES.031 TaxID=1798203 RepID=UPI000BF8ED89|nr:hypothetical protein [Thioclava sp. ES.031]PFG62762.1 hypothetical protein AXZ77_1348 [Thioclava sp. ES.031]